jgi:hypothetical protein
VVNAVHGVEVPWQKLCPLGPMTMTSPDVVFFLGSVNRSSFFLLCGLSSLVENLDLFWSGDGGVSGVAFLLGGVVLEDYARLVYCDGQRRGEEGGGLVKESSLRCQRRRKAVRRRALAW